MKIVKRRMTMKMKKMRIKDKPMNLEKPEIQEGHRLPFSQANYF